MKLAPIMKNGQLAVGTTLTGLPYAFITADCPDCSVRPFDGYCFHCDDVATLKRDAQLTRQLTSQEGCGAD